MFKRRTLLCGSIGAAVAALTVLSRVSIDFVAGGHSLHSDHKDRVRQREVTDTVGDNPLVIRPMVEPFLPLAEAEVEWIRHQIQPGSSKDLSPSTCLHVLRAHGLHARFPANEAFPTSHSVLEPLLDTSVASRIFGKSGLVRVSNGARYVTRVPPDAPRWLEHHRDQNLAAFAELGLPLSIPLKIDGQSHLHDVLRDSVANFHLQQKELEWTGLAYAIYLPPQTQWTNRYGECYSFDDLAMELLQRPMIGASCGGVHVLYTLMVILRVDRGTPILSSSTRDKVGQHLKRCSQLAVHAQQPDGWWPADWFFGSELTQSYIGQSPPASAAERLIITGHLTEWMLYLPEDVRPSSGTLRRAALWLLNHIKGLSEKEIAEQFCPCTHAVCVLRQLAIVDSADSGLNHR